MKKRFGLGFGCVVTVIACGSSDGASPNPGPSPALGQSQSGIATYYAATGAGNCGFDPSPNDLDVAAMNAEQYAGSAVCGSCVRVVGPKGEVTVRIVDQCPECKKGHLDLSKEAFAKIADVSAGRVDISWTVVACNVSGPVQYHFKDGSSQYWTAIQIRNHKLPITKLELKKNGAWTEIQRADYNYFVDASGAGTGPVNVRITGQGGATLEDTLAGGVVADTTVSGAKQFP
jgi:expansin (peptidoglycan-binding protein)